MSAVIATAARPPSATAAGSSRDVRLDLLRGLCVLLMIFGHLAWHRLETHFHLGFVTVAEAFFFLSGATLGVVARRRGEPGAAAQFDRRLLRRAVWLFAANLVAVGLARLLEGSRSFPGDYFDRYWGAAPEIERWLSLDQPSVLNVLPRYSVFLLLAPVVLWLLRRGAGVAVAALSGAVWLGSYLAAGTLVLPLFESPRAPYPVAAWQLIFFGGMLFGWWLRPHDAPDGDRPIAAAVLWLAATVLAVSVALEAGWWQPLAPPELARSTSRALLGPLRLLNFAAAVIVIWGAASHWGHGLASRLGALILPFGRWALPAFLLHIPFVWLLLAIPVVDTSGGLRKIAALLAIAGLLPLLHRPGVRRWLRP